MAATLVNGFHHPRSREHREIAEVEQLAAFGLAGSILLAYIFRSFSFYMEAPD